MCDIAIQDLNDEEKQRVKLFEDESGIGLLSVSRGDDGTLYPTLINGRPVDRSDWLEVVRIGNQSCTGTIVGRNCVITAAHCGRNNERSTLEVFNQGRVNYRMVHMPQWRNQSNYDLAVLVLDSDVDVTPARVGVDYSFTVGADVDICGYGCVRQGGGGGNDGVLRFGESKVQSFTGTDVVTQWRPGGAALCFGDSGGPMFANGSDAGGQRTLIAVNSKGNIRDTNYNMRLDLESVREWLSAVASQYSLEIVGVNSTPDNPDPEPNPEPGPNPDPGQGLKIVYSEIAKQHRETAVYYEGLATRYEGLAKDSNPRPDDGGGGVPGGGDKCFGLPPL